MLAVTQQARAQGLSKPLPAMWASCSGVRNFSLMLHKTPPNSKFPGSCGGHSARIDAGCVSGAFPGRGDADSFKLLLSFFGICVMMVFSHDIHTFLECERIRLWCGFASSQLV